MQHIMGSYKKGTGLVPGNISGNRTINAVANKMQVGCADEFEAFNCFYKEYSLRRRLPSVRRQVPDPPRHRQEAGE